MQEVEMSISQEEYEAAWKTQQGFLKYLSCHVIFSRSQTKIQNL